MHKNTARHANNTAKMIPPIKLADAASLEFPLSLLNDPGGVDGAVGSAEVVGSTRITPLLKASPSLTSEKSTFINLSANVGNCNKYVAKLALAPAQFVSLTGAASDAGTTTSYDTFSKPLSTFVCKRLPEPASVAVTDVTSTSPLVTPGKLSINAAITASFVFVSVRMASLASSAALIETIVINADISKTDFLWIVVVEVMVVVEVIVVVSVSVVTVLVMVVRDVVVDSVVDVNDTLVELTVVERLVVVVVSVEVVVLVADELVVVDKLVVLVLDTEEEDVVVVLILVVLEDVDVTLVVVVEVSEVEEELVELKELDVVDVMDVVVVNVVEEIVEVDVLVNVVTV